MKKILLFLSMSSSIIMFAQVAYGFESAQGYSLTNLAGQQGWGATTGSPTVVVSNTYANPGTQSMKISGANGTSHTAIGAISPTFSVAGTTVSVGFNAYFTSASTAGNECDFFFSPQAPSASSITSRMRFTYDNKIIVVGYVSGTLSYIDTGATFTKNAWHTYKIEHLFSSSQIKYYQDGVLIYTGGLVGPTAVENIAITNDNYDSSAYFDNIQIVSGILATEEVSKIPSIVSIYPNPTLDFLSIKADSKINSVSVYDSNGRKINVKLEGNKVDVSSLPSGNYLINIETKEGKTTEKFIKK